MATIRVEVKPELLRWARERSGLDFNTLVHRFPRLAEWEHEAVRPTLKQEVRERHPYTDRLFLPSGAARGAGPDSRLPHRW